MENKNNMKTKTSVPKPKNYYDVFPEIKDFYLFDKEENIKNFKKTDMKDPEYIFVFTENEKKEIHENIYKRKDFLSDYDFIKIETKNPEVYINCLIPKIKFNIGREARLLTEIKQRPSFIKEISRKYKINLNSEKYISFKEVFNIPTEKRFYNKIFTLHFYNRNTTKQPNNQNNNVINNNINNPGSNIYNNFNNGFYNAANNNGFNNNNINNNSFNNNGHNNGFNNSGNITGCNNTSNNNCFNNYGNNCMINNGNNNGFINTGSNNGYTNNGFNNNLNIILLII